ncbi:hypothetical protein VTN77DRAFT_7473 [Rasamsonia byssochlamydoides]|uniref:uncharacterized protein n=1 Tax=Rasamsonia byssochlamydoides TaxID=89139 RepID=UPI003743EB4B
MDRPSKRLKVSPGNFSHAEDCVEEPKQESADRPTEATGYNGRPLKSLTRSITPPRRSCSQTQSPHLKPQENPAVDNLLVANRETNIHEKDKAADNDQLPTIIPSPIKLTHIRDLPSSSGNNVDTVKLRDILGDPMIRECWQFNYLFDVDFLMSQFDEDVRNLVQVKVVHGSWKKEAPNRVHIDEACARYPNVEAITAYMPEPFGTHHSKMMILLRHDDLAQVVIHTANMIPGDWANMCQAVWLSPLLPLMSTIPDTAGVHSTAFGTGERFKRDLLAYLEAYGDKKTGPLVKQLKKYDFSAIRAALIASVPSKQKINSTDSKKAPLWGWPALKDTLRQIPLDQVKRTGDRSRSPHIVIQISSIASLGQTDKWLREVMFDSLCPVSVLSSPGNLSCPKYSIIFPTPDEIRRSLNGYGSGGSIHMKLQSAAQQKQLQYMRPYLCHWAGDREDIVSDITHKTPTEARMVKREAGRRRAAPHIKTYIRFSDATRLDRIDWAMVTSANLSTQAWGAAPNSNGEVRICSWEIGVIIWPRLFAKDHKFSGYREDDGTSDGNGLAEMVPCFKSDLPNYVASEEKQEGGRKDALPSTIVGFRMPYDLPLTPYGAIDMPWCATATYSEPDWLGQTWEG